MEMADNPKLDMAASSWEACVLKENTSTEKVSLLDHVNGFQYDAAKKLDNVNGFQCDASKKSDNFVIDMETFSHGVSRDITANSRIALQRTLSKKGSFRGAAAAAAAAEKKTNSVSNDRDTIPATASPRGPSTPEKIGAAALGSTDHSSGPHVHHQITMTTGKIIPTPESRGIMKRNSFKRSSPWVLDPKRILFFFATLSSMGTILLIYFTLSMKYSAGENNIH